MDKFAAELTRALTASGARQRAVAEEIGVDPSNISQWKTGHRPVPADKAPALAALVGTQPELISAAYADTMAAASNAPSGTKRVPIPAYEIEAVEDDEDFDSSREVWVQGVDIEVSAGDGVVVPEFIDTNYKQRFTLQWLRRVGAKADDLRVMRVRGDSMERTVFDGDKVVINLGDTKVVSNHVYVVVVGDEAKVKRLFRAADGRIRIVSDNPDKATYPDEYVEATADRFMVIGRVIDKSGPGGL
jgi:phage repressor protein C with HTH and peptisase S24 domain